MPDRGNLESARRHLQLSVMDLWIAYFALGGLYDANHLDRYLRGAATSSDHDHNIIVHALNETFTDRGQNSPIPYRNH